MSYEGVDVFGEEEPPFVVRARCGLFTLPCSTLTEALEAAREIDTEAREDEARGIEINDQWKPKRARYSRIALTSDGLPKGCTIVILYDEFDTLVGYLLYGPGWSPVPKFFPGFSAAVEAAKALYPELMPKELDSPSDPNPVGF